METLGGYRIVRKIAESLDVLYEAHDPTLGRRVALKELRLPDDLPPEQRRHAVQRFFREARAAGGLAHPNILQIYGAGEEAGRYFIAMEYLEGSTVRDLLQHDGPMPPQQAIPLAVQVANALEYAHARGVVHRDVKPDNIMVLPDGKVKLTDFGIAQTASDPTPEAEPVVGTPSYMSPEQVRGETTDARSDIFSLAATLYEMLSGRKPFAAEDVPAITRRILADEPDPAPEIPTALREVIYRALSKRPEDRFQSARDFGAALLACSTPAVRRASAQRTVITPRPETLPATPPSVATPPPTSQAAPPRLGSSIAEYLAARPQRRRRSAVGIVVGAIGLALILLFVAFAVVSVSRGFRARAVERQAADHLNRGAQLYQAGDYAEAVAEFQQAMTLAPDKRIATVARQNIVACYVSAGVEASELGLSQQALAYYRMALSLDPNNPAVHHNLGVELLKLGQEDAALAEWKAAMALDPSGRAGEAAANMIAQVRLNRGENLAAQGRIAEAVTEWQQAVAAAPDSQWGQLAAQQIANATGRGP